MAEHNTEKLQSAVVRYLKIRRDLGEKEITLQKQTVEVLKKLTRKPVVTPSTAPPVISAIRPAQVVADAHPKTAAQRGDSEIVSVGQNSLSKEEGLEVLRQEILADARLPALFQKASHMVFGVGDPHAAICFVGEAPGADEDREGEPFVGKAGQLLTKMIQTMGLSREQVYITNIVKYRPDMPVGSSGNRKPTMEELDSCRPYTFRQISLLKPQVIVALGATAVEGLLQRECVGITRLRGNWQEFEGIPVMPTFHPSFLLRNNSIPEKRNVWEDLLQVMDRVGLPISEKQRNFFKKS